MAKVPIPENLTSINDVPEKLHQLGIKIGYTGLMHYRNLGLIPAPEKRDEYKERFYDVEELAIRIDTVRLISAIFRMNFKNIAKLAKVLPVDIFNKLPIYFMKTYTTVLLKIKDPKKRELEQIVKKKLSYLGTIYLRNLYWTTLAKYHNMANNKTIEEFYDAIFSEYIRELKSARKTFDQQGRKELFR